MAASRRRLARNRWYSFSFGSHLLSRHQSAAALCQHLRVSVSARWMYHLLVSGLMWTMPLTLYGMSLLSHPSRSERRTGMRRTMRLPRRVLSFSGRDQNATELQ